MQFQYNNICMYIISFKAYLNHRGIKALSKNIKQIHTRFKFEKLQTKFS